MTLEEAIRHCEEVAENYEFISKDKEITEITRKGCTECAAEHRQLAAWLTELKEAKRLLKAAIKDIGDMSRYCLGMCCDSCPQIHTLSRGYQSCIWQHEDEALKLIKEEGE